MGFGQYRIEGEELVFTEFAMSCRVAGKFVESALFAHLLKQTNCAAGQFRVIKTKKNILLRKTLEQIGFAAEGQDDAQIHYRFTDALANCTVIHIGE